MKKLFFSLVLGTIIAICWVMIIHTLKWIAVRGDEFEALRMQQFHHHRSQQLGSAAHQEDGPALRVSRMADAPVPLPAPNWPRSSAPPIGNEAELARLQPGSSTPAAAVLSQRLRGRGPKRRDGLARGEAQVLQVGRALQRRTNDDEEDDNDSEIPTDSDLLSAQLATTATTSASQSWLERQVQPKRTPHLNVPSITPHRQQQQQQQQQQKQRSAQTSIDGGRSSTVTPPEFALEFGGELRGKEPQEQLDTDEREPSLSEWPSQPVLAAGQLQRGAPVAGLLYRAPFFTSWFVSTWNILFMPIFTLISSCCFRNEDSTTKKLLV